MRRTFGFDVLACPNCGAAMRLIALIDQAAVVARILRHLGLPDEIPPPAPARAPPDFFETQDAGNQKVDLRPKQDWLEPC